ncbi:MAG: hypothetical protein WCK77_15610 [Verrucomicrobiota bacterium]
MNLEKTSLPDIEAQLRGLRGPSQTNYFRQVLTGRNYWMAGTERTLVFLTDDLDFFRLYFYTTDAGDLGDVLASLRLPGTTVTACIARHFDSTIHATLQACGHVRHSMFRRMATRALRVCKVNSRLEFANPADVDELLGRLQADFHPYTSHPPSRALLAEYIRREWALVIRKNGAIAGYIVFQIAGNQANYNYLFNSSADPVDFLMLQNNFFGLLDQRGVRAGILWVDEKNTRVLKMNEVSGWKLDGLMTQYYVKVTAK